jgi:hypothetical protein
LYSQFLLLKAVNQVVAVGYARGVSDDERGTVVRFRFLECLDDVTVVAAECDLRDIDGTVADGLHGEVFAAVGLAAGGEFGNCAPRGGL